MKKERNSCTVHFLQDVSCLKSRGIWEDAGFTPPPVYMHLTEFLHLAYSNEGYISTDYLKKIINAVNNPEYLNTGLFDIKDRNRMYSFADSLGIDSLNGGDVEVAARITEDILSDYIHPDSPVFCSGKSPYNHKKGTFGCIFHGRPEE
ncbi:hypothetical protein J2128_002434 [Methanomicrobium sp. W14]|uniref:hypothetical protein n=1 Tax=Methanomicrobium sp. W14 TaxID=2817839 RepID=UPI001AE3B5EB|nr:hypothetical protein [Methanomicrobium sp. W14]MBP2134468.1 hypothetical protein [Methanomicrobium sp. W14]